MNPFWITLKDGSGICVEAESLEAALEKAKSHGFDPQEAKILPYPAEPRFGPNTDCPSFCFRPQTCQGRTACPRNYACSE